MYGDGFNDTIVNPASNWTHPQRGEFSDVYRLSYNIYPIIGFVVTSLVCIVASLATGGLDDVKNVDEKLIAPFMAKLFRMRQKKVEPK